MPELIIVAGPNGAGKTSFATEYVRASATPLDFVNADEIALGLAQRGHHPAGLDISAGRVMLRRIEELVEAGTDFLLETTLATLTYARKIPRWQASGYTVALLYLRLPDVEHSIARVRKRVASGGHGIPEETIRRRFARSLTYLGTYKPLVDEWYIWDSLEGSFRLAERWNDSR